MHHRISAVWLTVAAFGLLATPAFGQENNSGNTNTGNSKPRIPAVQDWSNAHTVFSNPSNPALGSNAPNTNNPTGQNQNNGIENNPRFTTQQNLRTLGGQNNPPANPGAPQNSANSNSIVGNNGSSFAIGNAKLRPVPKPAPKPTGDWSVALGTAANGGNAAEAPTMYPAKFSFDLNSGPSCTTDFVVYGENVTGAGPTTQVETGAFSAQSGTTGNVTIDSVTITPSASTASTATISWGATGAWYALGNNPANNSTVTITGGQTYRFVTSLTSPACSANDVYIDFNGSFSSGTSNYPTHLAKAIGLTGTTGTDYCAGTVASTNVTAGTPTNGSWGGGSVPLTNKTLGNITSSAFSSSSSPNASLSPASANWAGGTSGSTTSTTFATSSNTTTEAANLASAINLNPSLNVTAANNGGATVTVTANTAGVSHTFGATITNFGPWSQTTAGAAGQPSIVALNNLYTGAAVAASDTGTFTGQPTTSDTITVTNGANVMTLKTNPTPAISTGTFTAGPVSSGQTITVSTGTTITLTPGGTQAHAQANFGAATSTYPLATDSITLATASGSQVFHTSATPATAAGAFTGAGPILSTQSMTINTVTLTPGGTAAALSGAFSGTPAAADTIHLSVGGNAATFKISNATPASSLATFSAAALTGQNVTMNPGTALTLTVGGTAATRTATFTSTAVTGTIGITYATGSGGGATTNTLSITPGADTGTVTINSDPSGGDTITIGATAYAWHGTCSTAPCIVHSGTTTTDASNLAKAVNNTCGSSTYCLVSGANASATANYPGSGSVTTITNTSGSAITFTTSNGTAMTLSGSGTIPAATNGCTSATTGTFVASGSNTAQATAFTAAITACHTSYPAIGVQPTNQGSGAVLLTADAPGSAITLSVTAPTTGMTWTGSAVGTDGTNGCTSASAGTFINNGNTTTLAGNIQTAITNCHTNQSVALTAITATNTVTVSTTATGTGATLTGLGGTMAVAWTGTVSPGSNATTACPTLSTATYATSGSNAGLATNLVSAINACALGATASNASGASATVTVTYNAPGLLATIGSPTFSGSNTITGGVFPASWSLANGTDLGAATCSGSAGQFINSNVQGTLGSNFELALAACVTNGALTNVTVASSTNGGTVSSKVVGPLATAPTDSTAGTPPFSWTNTAGTNGSVNTCGNFALGSTATNTANNFITSLNACSSLAVTAGTVTSGAFTITANAPGNFSNAFNPTASVFSSSFFSWTLLNEGTDLSSATCSGTTGQYVNGTTAGALGTALYNTLSLCVTNSVLTGATVTTATNGATVTTTAKGSGVTLTAGGTIGNPPFSWANTAGTNGSATCPSLGTGTYATSSSTTTLATNLAAGINACNTAFSAIGVTASSSGAVVTVTASSTGSAGNNIAVATTSAGFSWLNPTFTGGTGAGLCNAYNGGQPKVGWSYDTHTSTGGPVTTSPVLTLDGSMVIFVESLSTGSVLHVLRPNTTAAGGGTPDGTVAAPSTVPTVINVNSGGTVTQWNNCLALTTACMLNFTYNATTNTRSSPYLDYGSNTLYVGDDNGTLWKIQNVGVTTGITALPSLATGTWAGGVQIHSGHKLTAPVLNYQNGNIYVGDDSGEVAQVSGTGSIVTTNTAEFTGITDSPVIDNLTNRVFVFGRNGEAASNSIARLVQFDASLANPAVPAIGTQTSGTLAQIHLGAFSDQYWNGTDPSYGFLYVCGKDSSGRAVLYRFGFNSSGVMSTSNSGGPLSLTASGTGDCSPLAEVYNANQGGGTDWLFVGIPNNCAFGGAATGCVMSFNITGNSSTSVMPTTAIATGNSSGGTSGIIVDNISTNGRASSLYFTTLGAPGCSNPTSTGTACAVQFTQSGLQ